MASVHSLFTYSFHQVCWTSYKATRYFPKHTSRVSFFLSVSLLSSLPSTAPGFSYSMPTLNCGMWDLVPWPGIEPRAPALGAQSPSHWTTKEVPEILFHWRRPSLVVQSLSHVQLFGTPWTAAHQASLPFTISQSLLKLMSIESVMPSNHLILCHPLLLLPSSFSSIKVFSSE